MMRNISRSFRIRFKYENLILTSTGHSITSYHKPITIYYHSQHYQKTMFHQLSSQFTTNRQLITNLTEILEGNAFWKQKKINLALERYEKAFSILPHHFNHDQEANAEIHQIAIKLLQCYIFMQKYAQSRDLLVILNSHTNKDSTLQELLHPKSIEIKEKLITKFHGRNSLIEKQLTLNQQPLQMPSSDSKLSKLSLNQSDKAGIFLIKLLNSILETPGFTLDSQYHKICNSFLKRCEKQPNHLVKGLLVIIINLIRKEQFLQAEGIIQHCLDLKVNNLSHELLLHNQQYILLKLLLSEVFFKVKRGSEATKIKEEFENKFSYESFMIQVESLPSTL